MSESIKNLEALSEYLKNKSRLDVKAVALEYILGLSGTKEGIKTLIENESIVKDIVSLVNDDNELISKDAILFLVNFTAELEGIECLFKLNKELKILQILRKCILDENNKHADPACMVLSNLTRDDTHLEVCVTEMIPTLPKLIEAFVNLNYNKKGAKLHYIGPVISNLCRHRSIVDYLMRDEDVPLMKLLPFCHYNESTIRRGGAVGIIRNISFNVDLHGKLLDTQMNLLTYILYPLIGNEEYPDEEMETLPLDLQYMPDDKLRERDPDLRRMLLEVLARFCIKRDGRDRLRSNGVYYVLRELHKSEKDRAVLLACENVVDILIRKESEINKDDLTNVNVPEDMSEKFHNMDNEFINSC